ncbi:MAG: protein of unknown function DUF1345 [Burkholderiaceae bacterium]|jgi:uncharacterized membrane protein|nr:MAG: protein of unknown function DUF1345 [Burkholderiaceae bacterium]
MRRHFSETTAHRRLLYALAAGLAVGLAPLPLAAPAHGLLGWCVGSSCYLALAWWLAIEFDAERTRARAQAQDQSDVALFLLMLLVVFASVAAIVLLLQSIKGLSPAQRSGHLLLVLAALACSWLVLHTIFAFRYAHRYYQELLEPGPNGGGLEFPGALPPDYFDFLYSAFVIGMTSQVSDVQVTSREMRRLTLVHSVLAFAFNMLVLALGINVVAGAIQ